jgi:hypothetical protein
MPIQAGELKNLIDWFFRILPYNDTTCRNAPRRGRLTGGDPALLNRRAQPACKGIGTGGVRLGRAVPSRRRRQSIEATGRGRPPAQPGNDNIVHRTRSCNVMRYLAKIKALTFSEIISIVLVIAIPLAIGYGLLA